MHANDVRGTLHAFARRSIRVYRNMSSNKPPIIAFVVAVALLAGLAGIYFFKKAVDDQARQRILQQLAQHQGEAPVSPEPPAGEPGIQHPLPEEPPAQSASPKPLPPLNDSDAALRGAVAALVGPQPFADLWIPREMVRHVVATVDNLPRKKLAVRLLPVRLPVGQIATNGEGDATSLSPANYARYTPYVRLVQAVDARQLVAAYVHFYPLFQEAYKELGYRNAYFNDRLVEAIDDLLAAPELAEPVLLVRPKVLYEFSDPQLEARSAGQKVMIRIGPQNAGVVKAKLRELRQALAGKKAP
jgi:Protein of unknown function (DUF3014)